MIIPCEMQTEIFVPTKTGPVSSPPSHSHMQACVGLLLWFMNVGLYFCEIHVIKFI